MRAVCVIAPLLSLAVMVGMMVQAAPHLWPWTASVAAYAFACGWMMPGPEPRKKEQTR
jgi:hypothetical protein